MLKAVILFAVGLALICLSGDRFVDSSVAIAKRLGIPNIVVGATIVSLGTTLPEVLVSTTAALQGSADIALGNSFGSIICNTALIAGLGQLVAPTKKFDTKDTVWRLALFALAGAGIFLLGLCCGRLSRIAGVALLLGFVFYAYMSIRNPGTDSGEESASGSLARSIIMLAVCAALLFVGARLLVDNGIILAEALGVPERIIAVTFIALGTSLPELVTTVTSLIKHEGDVGLGNIIGANILNLLLVLGIPASIAGINVSAEAVRLELCQWWCAKKAPAGRARCCSYFTRSFAFSASATERLLHG